MSVKMRSKVGVFLYLLMRDDLPLGRVEQLVREVESHERFEMSNEHLAMYADELIVRLNKE